MLRSGQGLDYSDPRIRDLVAAAHESERRPPPDASTLKKLRSGVIGGLSLLVALPIGFAMQLPHAWHEHVLFARGQPAEAVVKEMWRSYGRASRHYMSYVYTVQGVPLRATASDLYYDYLRVAPGDVIPILYDPAHPATSEPNLQGAGKWAPDPGIKHIWVLAEVLVFMEAAFGLMVGVAIWRARKAGAI